MYDRKTPCCNLSIPVLCGALTGSQKYRVYPSTLWCPYRLTEVQSLSQYSVVPLPAHRSTESIPVLCGALTDSQKYRVYPSTLWCPYRLTEVQSLSQYSVVPLPAHRSTESIPVLCGALTGSQKYRVYPSTLWCPYRLTEVQRCLAHCDDGGVLRSVHPHDTQWRLRYPRDGSEVVVPVCERGILGEMGNFSAMFRLYFILFQRSAERDLSLYGLDIQI